MLKRRTRREPTQIPTNFFQFQDRILLARRRRQQKTTVRHIYQSVFFSRFLPPLRKHTKRRNRNVEHHQGKEERSFRHRRRCVARIHHPLAQESMLIIPIHSHFVTIQALRSIFAICLISVRSAANRRSAEFSMSIYLHFDPSL